MNIVISSIVAVSLLTGGYILNNKTQVLTTVLPVTEVVNVVNNKTVASTAKKKTVKTLKLDDDQVIYIEGEIDESAGKLAEKIKRLGLGKKPIYLLIDSPGGSVLDGAKIVSAMEASSAQVNTVCIGLCASMAAIIHGYGDERYMVDRSILMHHPAAAGLRGSLEEMQSRLGLLIRYVDKQSATIANRAGLTLEQFKALVVSEMWIDGEDAVNKKFAEGLVSVVLPEEKDSKVFAIGNNKDEESNDNEKLFDFTWK